MNSASTVEKRSTSGSEKPPLKNAELSSIIPTIHGVPWWGGTLFALILTCIGAVSVSNGADTHLDSTFKWCYLLGCVVAVLAVRRRALFTTVFQTPLILFGVAFFTLYLVNSDSSSDQRTVLLRILLAIATLFPLMAWTFIFCAAIAAVRYFVLPQVLPQFFGDGEIANTAQSGKPKTAKTPTTKITSTKSAERKPRPDVESLRKTTHSKPANSKTVNSKIVNSRPTDESSRGRRRVRDLDAPQLDAYDPPVRPSRNSESRNSESRRPTPPYRPNTARQFSAPTPDGIRRRRATPEQPLEEHSRPPSPPRTRPQKPSTPDYPASTLPRLRYRDRDAD